MFYQYKYNMRGLDVFSFLKGKIKSKLSLKLVIGNMFLPCKAPSNGHGYPSQCVCSSFGQIIQFTLCSMVDEPVQLLATAQHARDQKLLEDG